MINSVKFNIISKNQIISLKIISLNEYFNIR